MLRTVDPKLLDAVIRSGCKAAIAAEPNLTKWDTVLGDGDCGEAVKGVSEGMRIPPPSPKTLSPREAQILKLYLCSNYQDTRQRWGQ